jgi:hypothetical protein
VRVLYQSGGQMNRKHDAGFDIESFIALLHIVVIIIIIIIIVIIIYVFCLFCLCCHICPAYFFFVVFIRCAVSVIGDSAAEL